MKKKTMSFLLIISLIGISLTGFNHINSNKQNNNEEIVRTVNIEADFMAEFDNKQILAGTVDYIFTGEVIEKLGEIDNLAYPTTQFKVNVNTQLQGELPNKELTINQYGGHITEEIDGKSIDTLYLFEGDPLLVPENEYVFAANKQLDGSILLIPLYGNTKIDANSMSKSNSSIDVVEEFKNAVKNPIVPELQQRINESK